MNEFEFVSYFLASFTYPIIAFTAFTVLALFALALAVNTDAKARGVYSPNLWSCAILGTGFIGGIVYLCCRNKQTAPDAEKKKSLISVLALAVAIIFSILSVVCFFTAIGSMIDTVMTFDELEIYESTGFIEDGFTGEVTLEDGSYSVNYSGDEIPTELIGPSLSFFSAIPFTFIASIVSIISYVILCIAVYKDAKVFNNENATLFTVLTVFFGALVMLIYLGTRSKNISAVSGNEAELEAANKFASVALGLSVAGLVASIICETMMLSGMVELFKVISQYAY